MTRNDIIKNAQNLKGFKSGKVKYFMNGKNQAVLVKGELDSRYALKCPVCGKTCPGYDTQQTPKRVRALDMGSIQCFIEFYPQRVECPEHGVHIQLIPFVRHKSRYTRDFEDTVIALSKEMNTSALARYMRIDWHSVEGIVGRVADEVLPADSVLFKNLKRIGIDETSYKKGHKYLTVVVNHDTGEVIFAKPGHDYETLKTFFEALSPEQSSEIEVVTGDGAKWIKKCVAEFTSAAFCIDRYHVTQWAIEALDQVRKNAWKVTAERKKSAPKHGRGRPKKGEVREKYPTAKDNKGLKYALGKNPDHLTDAQRERLNNLRKTDFYLYRAWELKENLRRIFDLSPDVIEVHLKGWCNWASHCQIPEFVELGKKIRRHMEAIIQTVKFGMSNARIEATNNKIKVLIRRAYGYRNVNNLIAKVKLYTSRVELDYPGRDRCWDASLMAE